MQHARQRTAPHHRDRRAGAGEPRLLRRRARHAARQEERQPGRSRHLSPLLCRRGRTSGHRPDVLPVGAAGAAAHGPRPGASRSASRCRPAASTYWGTRLQQYGARIERASRRASASRSAARRSARAAAGAGRERARRRATVHAVGGQPGRRRASGARSLRRAALGARRGADRGVPHRRARLRAARHRETAGRATASTDAAGRASTSARRRTRGAAPGASAAVHHLAWRVDDEAASARGARAGRRRPARGRRR